jgi:hypothetical protein
MVGTVGLMSVILARFLLAELAGDPGGGGLGSGSLMGSTGVLVRPLTELVVSEGSFQGTRKMSFVGLSVTSLEKTALQVSRTDRMWDVSDEEALAL